MLCASYCVAVSRRARCSDLGSFVKAPCIVEPFCSQTCLHPRVRDRSRCISVFIKVSLRRLLAHVIISQSARSGVHGRLSTTSRCNLRLFDPYCFLSLSYQTLKSYLQFSDILVEILRESSTPRSKGKSLLSESSFGTVDSWV